MSVKSFFAKTAANVALKAKVAAPHLFVGVGVIGLVGAGVIACVQTARHFDEILEVHDKNIKEVRKLKDADKAGDIELTDDERQQLTAGVYIKTFYKGLKVYALPVGLGILSIASICYGHGLLNKRYAAASALAAALKESYDTARKRAHDRFGEDIEKNIFDDARKEIVTVPEVDEETGEVKEKTVEQYVTDSDAMSKHPYTFLYNIETAPTTWTRTPGYNNNFIGCQIAALNRRLGEKGFITINEALEAFGINPDDTDIGKIGFTHGWRYINPDKTVNVVDIDCVGCTCDHNDPGYFRGGMPDYYLKFNVQGDITRSAKVAARRKERAESKRKKAWIR